MSVMSLEPHDYMTEKTVILPGSPSVTRIEFGIPVIRDPTVDRFCLKSVSHRQCSQDDAASLNSPSDTSQSSQTSENAKYYGDHTTNAETTKPVVPTTVAVDHTQVEQEISACSEFHILPEYIAKFIRDDRAGLHSAEQNATETVETPSDILWSDIVSISADVKVKPRITSRNNMKTESRKKHQTRRLPRKAKRADFWTCTSCRSRHR